MFPVHTRTHTRTHTRAHVKHNLKHRETEQVNTKFTYITMQSAWNCHKQSEYRTIKTIIITINHNFTQNKQGYSPKCRTGSKTTDVKATTNIKSFSFCDQERLPSPPAVCVLSAAGGMCGRPSELRRQTRLPIKRHHQSHSYVAGDVY